MENTIFMICLSIGLNAGVVHPALVVGLSCVAGKVGVNQKKVVNKNNNPIKTHNGN